MGSGYFRREHGLDQQLEQERQKEEFLKDFVTKGDDHKADGGHRANLFVIRANMVRDWLRNEIQPAFASYKKAFEKYQRFIDAGLETRLPQSKQIISLSLDVSPEVSEARAELIKAKRNFYEAIRSTKIKKHTQHRLALDNGERINIIEHLVKLCPKLNMDVPQLDHVLLTDETFSVSEEELADPKKEINYPYLDYFLTFNNAAAAVANELKKLSLEEPKKQA